jgi:hypothetical protein
VPYPKARPPKFKLQVQEDESDPRLWHDVHDAAGRLYLFDRQDDARAKLEELFPVLFKLEQFAAGPKRTRVIAIHATDDEEEDNK